YLAAQLDLVEGRRRIPAGESISAVDETAAVAPSALVRASILGAGVRVGEDAEVVSSVVHERATIGAKARVCGSIVGAGAAIGEGATIEDLSVVGDGESVAAGAALQG